MIARHILANVDLTSSPKNAGERWFYSLLPALTALAHVVDFVEVPVNERFSGSGEIGRFAEASARFVELAADKGVRVIVGNFSTGTPEPQDAALFLPAMETAFVHGGALGLHEYGLPNDLALTWEIGRWVRFYEACARQWPDAWKLQLYLTEFGVDGGNEKPPRPRAQAGWRAYYNGPTAGAQYAAWLDRAVQEEENFDAFQDVLRGVCLFNCGDYADNSWASFEVGGAPELVAWVAASPKATTPGPTPTPTPAATVDYGKVVWFLEDAQRRAEGEGLQSVSDFIGSRYTADAKARRDGKA